MTSKHNCDGWGWLHLRAALVVALVLSFALGPLAESVAQHDAGAIAMSLGHGQGAQDGEIAADPSDPDCGIDPGCMPGLIFETPILAGAPDTGNRPHLTVPGHVSQTEPAPDHPPIIL